MNRIDMPLRGVLALLAACLLTACEGEPQQTDLIYQGEEPFFDRKLDGVWLLESPYKQDESLDITLQILPTAAGTELVVVAETEEGEETEIETGGMIVGKVIPLRNAEPGAANYVILYPTSAPGFMFGTFDVMPLGRVFASKAELIENYLGKFDIGAIRYSFDEDGALYACSLDVGDLRVIFGDPSAADDAPEDIAPLPWADLLARPENWDDYLPHRFFDEDDCVRFVRPGATRYFEDPDDDEGE